MGFGARWPNQIQIDSSCINTIYLSPLALTTLQILSPGILPMISMQIQIPSCEPSYIRSAPQWVSQKSLPLLWLGLILWICYVFLSAPMAVTSGISGSTGQLAGSVSKAVTMVDTERSTLPSTAPWSHAAWYFSQFQREDTWQVHVFSVY